MIGEHVIKCTIFPHGDSSRASKACTERSRSVVLGHDAIVHLVVCADEVGGHAVHDALDSPAIPIMYWRHKQIDTTLGYARLYDGTLAADYYSAMNKVEWQLALPEACVKEPPMIGELIALTDALRNGSLNPAQTEIVRALREG